MTDDPKALAKARHILTLRDENVPGCCVSDAAPVADAYLASEAARKEAELRVRELPRLHEAIAHGDDEHKRWLKDALTAWAIDQPVPLPTGLDNKERADKAEAEVARLREALEIIAGKRQCINNLMSDKDIAREALASPDAAGEETIIAAVNKVLAAAREWKASMVEDGWTREDILSDWPRPGIAKIFLAIEALDRATGGEG